MTPTIEPSAHPDVVYLLRLADTCLILSHRLSEWCGHAPVLEEDIALSNMALDLVGQSRSLLTLAGGLHGQSYDEDQLAFLRQERHYYNPTLVELPRGDFAVTVTRNAMVSAFLLLLWERLKESSNAQLAAIAGKATKEARYHLQHAGDWVMRLGGGTVQSQQKMQAALAQLWRYHNELFVSDAVDAQAKASGLGPDWSSLQAAWHDQMVGLFSEAGLVVPANGAYVSTGKWGQHSEHMGFILTEMQYLQRAYPGGAW